MVKNLIAPDQSCLCQAEAESSAHSFQVSQSSSPLCWPHPLHLIPGKAITNFLLYLALIAVISLDKNILQQQEGFCSVHSNCDHVNIELTNVGSYFATFSLQ